MKNSSLSGLLLVLVGFGLVIGVTFVQGKMTDRWNGSDVAADLERSARLLETRFPDRFGSWVAVAELPSDPKQGRLLQSGWNLIGLVPTSSLMDAPTLLASLDGASGTTATALEAARWQSGAWDSHLRTAPVNRFALELGRGYFVRLTRPVAWTHVGGSPASGITR